MGYGTIFLGSGWLQIAIKICMLRTNDPQKKFLSHSPVAGFTIFNFSFPIFKLQMVVKTNKNMVRTVRFYRICTVLFEIKWPQVLSFSWLRMVPKSTPKYYYETIWFYGILLVNTVECCQDLKHLILCAVLLLSSSMFSTQDDSLKELKYIG
jgi:hypothetical protein